MDQPPDINSEDELVDKIANRIVMLLGSNIPVKRVRKSQLLSALVGAVGFALFVSGVEDAFGHLPPWILILMGFLLMALTGLLLENLKR